MASVVCFGSARFPFCGVAPRSSGVVRSTSPGRGASGASVFSRSPSSLPAGEVDDFGAVVRLQRSSPSSCEHAEAEKGNFPSAMISSVAFKDAPAPGGCRNGVAAARSPSASVVDVCWDPRDLVVISGFVGYVVSAVLVNRSGGVFAKKKKKKNQTGLSDAHPCLSSHRVRDPIELMFPLRVVSCPNRKGIKSLSCARHRPQNSKMGVHLVVLHSF